MTLTNQVTSLEPSRKLRDLDVGQESLLKWEVGIRGTHLLWPRDPNERIIDTADVREYFAAFTVAELGEMLPSGFLSGRADALTTELPSLYFCRLEGFELTIANTEADARAKMLIYLIEQGLIKV